MIEQSKAKRLTESLKAKTKPTMRSLVESPVKFEQELMLFTAFGFMSERAINQRYQYLGNLGKEKKALENVEVYYSKKHNHFRAGIIEPADDEPINQLSILTQISHNDIHQIDVKSIPGLKNPFQVGLVETRDSHIGRGIAKSLYLFLIRIGYELVSDCEQYLGGYWLWKSLSSSDKINVYVWNDLKKDYLRDDNGKLIRYNGSNIPEDEIWSTDESKLHTVLVSTAKTL